MRSFSSSLLVFSLAVLGTCIEKEPYSYPTYQEYVLVLADRYPLLLAPTGPKNRPLVVEGTHKLLNDVRLPAVHKPALEEALPWFDECTDVSDLQQLYCIGEVFHKMSQELSDMYNAIRYLTVAQKVAVGRNVAVADVVFVVAQRAREQAIALRPSISERLNVAAEATEDAWMIQTVKTATRDIELVLPMHEYNTGYDHVHTYTKIMAIHTRVMRHMLDLLWNLPLPEIRSYRIFDLVATELAFEARTIDDFTPVYMDLLEGNLAKPEFSLSQKSIMKQYMNAVRQFMATESNYYRRWKFASAKFLEFIDLNGSFMSVLGSTLVPIRDRMLVYNITGYTGMVSDISYQCKNVPERCAS